MSNDVHQQMVNLVFGYTVSQALRAFAELAVADQLADGPCTADEIAHRAGTAPDATFRLMRAGLAIGVVTIDADKRFRRTPLLDTLRKDVPGSLRGFALSMTNPSHWLPVGQFVTAIRDGGAQAENALGLPIFEYLEQNPALAAEFTGAMEDLTALWAADVPRQLDTSGVDLAVDVGGRDGALVRLLQKDNPELRGIVFDRPDVAAAVKADVEGERLQVVGGDFFKELPAADLYLLKFILHDWDDESCVQILSRCREAMLPGGRVAVIDGLIEEGGDPGIVALFDLLMLSVAGGRERTLEEFDALFAKAGLRRTAVRTADSPQKIIEAVAA